MDELKETVETLIELDEPEAMLSTIRKAAAKQKGKRWETLAAVLGEAEVKLDQLLNAKPAGPDFTSANDAVLATMGSVAALADLGRAAQEAKAEPDDKAADMA